MRLARTRRSVVVIGAGMGGLSAAIHARLAGHDVLVLERHSRVGGKAAAIEQAGYRLDPGPSIVILTRIYEAVFRAAGRRMEDYLRFLRLDPISRVYFGSETPLDLPASRDDAVRLLREVDRDDAEALERLMAKLERVAPHIDRSIFAHPFERPWQLANRHLLATAMGFDVRKTYKELVDGMFRSPLMRAFFYGFPSYGGQTFDSKAAGALLIPYLMLQEGVFYPEGGVGAIPAAFERLARELGVEFRTEAEVTGLHLREGKIEEVRLRDGGVVKAESFIANVDRFTVGAWLGRPESRAPSFSYFTLHWGIRRRLSGLKHHTLIVPQAYEEGFEALYRQRRFPHPPIVYLNDTTDTDPSTAPPDRTNLFAVVTSPAQEPHLDWGEATPHYRGQVLGTLRSAGIEIQDADLDFERIQTPNYFAEAHGNYRGSLYGIDERHRLFGGLFPLSNRDEGIANLFYCGGSVQPGAGLPMVTLSGRFAAELL